MSNTPLVTVITATTGDSKVKQNLDSVSNQTYENIQHIVVVDGAQFQNKLVALEFEEAEKDIVVLPRNTGYDQYNGHRIYGGFTFMAEGEYVMYLDEDNWLEPDHVEKLIEAIKRKNVPWGYSFRQIRDQMGNFVCKDDCESLGMEYHSCIGDYFVDVNCFMFSRTLAINLAPGWFRRARNPNEQPEVDRLFSMVLKNDKVPFAASGCYTVNYRAGNREDSVQTQFFLANNAKMYAKYNGLYPWRKV